MFRGQDSRVFHRHTKMINFFLAKMSNYTVCYFITLEFVFNSVRYAAMKCVYIYKCAHELKYLSFCFFMYIAQRPSTGNRHNDGSLTYYYLGKVTKSQGDQLCTGLFSTQLLI